MASPAFSSNYNGDVLDFIITAAVTENEAVSKGSVYVIEDVPNKISIAKMVSSANPIIPREAMPTTKSATVTWSEATLTPVDMMIYVPDINPRIFEAAWREFQPTGALPNKVLDPQIQATFAEVVLKQAQNQVGRLFWQGDTSLAASSPLHFFDGYITRAIASATNIDATNAGVLSATTIIQALTNVDAAIPDALYDDPDMVIHMNTTNFRQYQDAIIALSNKGQGNAEVVPPVFKGRELRHYSGFPANYLLAAKATTGTDSNLYAATDRANDVENLIIEKLRPEGEHYFLKALFKMDANFSYDAETVYYIGS
jgi:hypothetical protein